MTNSLCPYSGSVCILAGNNNRFKMKRILQIAGILIMVLFIYLIVVYFVRNDWNAWEIRLAIIGFLISIPLLLYTFLRKDT